MAAAATLAQSTNDEWMWEAVDGCADRDPNLPDRASDYCRYCWAHAAEMTALAGKPKTAASAAFGYLSIQIAPGAVRFVVSGLIDLNPLMTDNGSQRC